MREHEAELFNRFLDEHGIGDSSEKEKEEEGSREEEVEKLREDVERLEDQIEELASVIAHMGTGENPVKGSKGSEEEEKVEEPEDSDASIEDRYPLGQDHLYDTNRTRIKYELVWMFNKRQNEGMMTIYEIVNTIWGYEPSSAKDKGYSKVYEVFHKNKDLFTDKGEYNKQYSLKPSLKNKEVTEVI